MALLLVPFFLQGVAMLFDEFYFHQKRGLPLWERVGHPLDTLSVLACFVFLSVSPATETNLYIYICLCAFSCALITKDEFVHSKICDAKEQWLHSILFVLHPVVFLSAYVIWSQNLNPTLLWAQSAVLVVFIFYQTIYWSLREKSK
jgi:hypothetical protein